MERLYSFHCKSWWRIIGFLHRPNEYLTAEFIFYQIKNGVFLSYHQVILTEFKKRLRGLVGGWIILYTATPTPQAKRRQAFYNVSGMTRNKFYANSFFLRTTARYDELPRGGFPPSIFQKCLLFKTVFNSYSYLLASRSTMSGPGPYTGWTCM